MTATVDGWQFAASVCRYDRATHRVRIMFERGDVGPQISRMAWIDVVGPRPDPSATLAGYVTIDSARPREAVCEFSRTDE